MIIEGKNNDFEIVGEDTSKQASISAKKMAKLQHLLTEGLYKDPVTAVIAEWTNNGVDSVVQAGKNPVENPVIVRIGRNGMNQYMLSVEDKGTGLDKDDFENTCMNYLESTKEDDNDTIGHFGIGMKSFLSLERSATFTCRKAGMEYKYLVFKGPQFANYELIYEKPTVEPNGVIAELTLGSHEYNNFVTKAKQKLCYYDTVVLITDGDIIQHNKIYRNKLFQWAAMSTQNTMHIALKDVYYSIDWEALGITQITLPLALRFDLSSGITPTPSRETYISNERTKKLILDRIKEVADWFANKYNSEVKEYDYFMQGYEQYGTTIYNVVLKEGDGSRSFCVNNIMHHTSVNIKKPTVKGLTLNNPEFYKTHFGDFFFGLETVGYEDWRRFRRKRFYHSPYSQIQADKKVVLVGEDFKGNLKEFLRKRHAYTSNGGTLYAKRTKKRILGGLSGRDKDGVYDNDSYNSILDLSSYDKEVWRDYIQEWQKVENEVLSLMIDETGCYKTKEYVQWIEDKKQAQKDRRKQVGYVPNGLNKQKGDVTIAYQSVYYNRISFKRKAIPIKDLDKHKYITVLLKKDDIKDEIKEFVINFLPKPVRFAMIGPLELKKIPDSPKFINYQQFMSRDCKPFMRLASAILYERIIAEYEGITESHEGIFKNCIKVYQKDVETLEKYIEKNPTYGLTEPVKDMIIDVALEKDIFDQIIWDSYVRLKEAIVKYDWITVLAVPDSSDSETVKKYNKIITQVLLFRKKYYNEFPENAEIVFRDPEEEVEGTVQEELDEDPFDDEYQEEIQEVLAQI